MAEDSARSVRLERIGTGRFTVHNARGGQLTIDTGEGTDFTPVELLLAAIGGCTGIDVDLMTTKKVQPLEFRVDVTGDKIRDENAANRVTNLEVTFTVRFPEGEAGEAARHRLPSAVKISHDRVCTVSRTVELGSPIATSLG